MNKHRYMYIELNTSTIKLICFIRVINKCFYERLIHKSYVWFKFLVSKILSNRLVEFAYSVDYVQYDTTVLKCGQFADTSRCLQTSKYYWNSINERILVQKFINILSQINTTSKSLTNMKKKCVNSSMNMRFTKFILLK